MSVGIVVLAAGASRRMGTPKLLLRFEGQTLLSRTVTAALGSGGNPVVVVLGDHAASLAPELAGLPLHVVENPDWAEGMASSLRCGLSEVLARDPHVSGVVVTPCDLPHLEAAVLRALIERHAGDPARSAASEYEGHVGVPALLGADLFAGVAALHGDCGARALLRASPDLIRVPFAGGAYDVDEPADYARLHSRR